MLSAPHNLAQQLLLALVPAATLAAVRTQPADSTQVMVCLEQQNESWWFGHTGMRKAGQPPQQRKLFVSAGVDHVMWTGDNFGSPNGNEYERAVQQKYAGNHTAWAEATVRIIAGAGFNTLGSWSSATCPDCWQQDGAAQAAARRNGIYYTPIILFTHLYNKEHGTAGFPDVFDHSFNVSAWSSARSACAARATDPLVLGYFLDNEDSCPPYPERSTTTNQPGALESFLRLPAGSPGHEIAVQCQSALALAAAATDLAEVRRLRVAFAARVARQYFQVTSAAIRHVDPNHLILGCKFTDGDGLAPLVEAAAPFVDAHALDVYTFTPGQYYMRHLYEKGGRKPFIIAEFGFQARESFVNRSVHMGGPGPLLQTQQQRGAAWSSFVEKLLALPFVVGYHHFQYTDQPSDPAKPRNTNYGMVSVNDTEYTEMLRAMRATNLDAHRLHAAGAAGQHCELSVASTGDTFRGSIRHNLTGLCLTADPSGGGGDSLTPVLAACGTRAEVQSGRLGSTRAVEAGALWQSLANGRLQHVESAKCLDIDRSVPQSTKVVLSSNCSTDIEVEEPASWEHGSDCFVMNFCRWMGMPLCGYGQACLSYVATSESAKASVESALCVPGAPELVWAFDDELDSAAEEMALAPPSLPQLSAPLALPTPLLTFQFRCRATPITPRSSRDHPAAGSGGGENASGKNVSFGFFSAASKISAPAGAWSSMGSFTAQDSAHAQEPFPPYPIKLLHLTVTVPGLSAAALTEVDVEVENSAGVKVVLHARLFGPSMGIMVTEIGKPDGPIYWTVRQYNHWKYFRHFPNATTPPTKFEVVGRFIGSSDDLDEWAEGITALVRTGFRGVALPAEAPLGTLMQHTGAAVAPLFSGGVYSTPGGAFDFNCGNSTADVAWKLDQFANATATQYRNAGFDLTTGATFAMADEPGWYFPAALDTSTWPARVFESWREFLRNASLSLSDLGAASWEQVVPIGRSAATTLPMRRRYYWSCRFFSIFSARHFAEQTRAMERHFHPDMTVFVNWNNFAGRLFVPGPLGNNGQKGSPDSGYGSHDWFDFGRARGATVLWTEDWFGSGDAWQWSYYANRLRGAAELAPDHDVTFGGYVVGRDATPSGLAQKVLALAGSGAKALRMYTFGPEYMFKGNSYSEHSDLFAAITRSLDIIGAAEPVLFPGRRPAAEIAILYPRSSFMWDEWGQKSPTTIEDETNSNMDGRTTDYMAEVHGLFALLSQTYDLPVDFIDEDEATNATRLSRFRVVFVTEPSLPRESQAALAAYAAAGGTVVLSRGAGECLAPC